MKVEEREYVYAIVDEIGDVAYIDKEPKFYKGLPCGSVTSIGRTVKELREIAYLLAASDSLFSAAYKLKMVTDALRALVYLSGGSVSREWVDEQLAFAEDALSHVMPPVKPEPRWYILSPEGAYCDGPFDDWQETGEVVGDNRRRGFDCYVALLAGAKP